MRRGAFVALAFGVALAAPRPVHAEAADSPVPGLSCAATARPMARLELLFGLSEKSGRAISRARWEVFLAREVTPRFPEGLTMIEGRGQWRDAPGRIVREAMRMVVVWYAPSVDSEARIEAIRAAYIKQFRQKSVMRVDGYSCVSF